MRFTLSNVALSQTFALIAIFLPLTVLAHPLGSSPLQTRATCADGNPSPCICGNAFGIREGSLKCPQIGFHFKDLKSPTDGTIIKVTGNPSSQGKMECDHVVELQFIANEVAKNPAICTHFQQNANDLASFITTINDTPNLALVESVVNNAKGVLFGGGSFQQTTQKAANGVASYMTLLEAQTSAPFTGGAQALSNALDTIMGGAGKGFSNFQAAYDAKVKAVIASAKAQAAKLTPAAAPGDPFVDETASTIARCKRSTWEQVKDLVVRAVTGKKTNTTPASCALPTKAPAKTTKATTANTPGTKAATPTKALPNTTAKTVVPKTTAKKAVPKTTAKKAVPKTTAKKVAPKATAKVVPKTTAKVAPKTTAKKIAPKTTAKKAVPKTTAKKAAPKTTAKKAIPKPVAKKAVTKKAVPKKTTVKKTLPKKPVVKKAGGRRL